jgi:hypothetical protein
MERPVVVDIKDKDHVPVVDSALGLRVVRCLFKDVSQNVVLQIYSVKSIVSLISKT